MGYDREREVAVEAVREAARLCVDVRKSLVGAMEKEDRSPVTVADFGSQALVCRRLKSVFPNDPIVAEEDASVLRGGEQTAMRKTVCEFVRAYAQADEGTICDWIDAGNGDVAERFWTLDPIDGTKGFLRGDQYAVALALVDCGEVKVAALACPALPVDMEEMEGDCGVLFVAVRGEGTRAMSLEGGDVADVRIDDPAWRFAESVESSHGDFDAQGAVARAVGIVSPSLRMDSQVKYGAVARGDAALYLRLPSPEYPDYRENIWDHAAGALIVEEAGGKVSDMFGRPLDFVSAAQMEDNRGVVVSAREIHARVIGALRDM
ncbi:MAG: 3'(2'),5'-bisphosphate nucleotidase [Gemmatimonadetes bacterium]|nr:3'(2'),5'-bisphosphate nucleotidase [Gemmatimonadota bacterium]MYF72117.1 3'(2'),5'-bisphosphate nucleotidase [Gemmatimonadota bacterium]MYK54139.1 3'(2'),5'-bisphosphate nucleotidase [Gemmatimonadota bacterium]